MGACGSLCDCLQSRPRDAESPERGEPFPRIPNPFRDTTPYSSAQVYTILGKHPNGLTYGK